MAEDKLVDQLVKQIQQKIVSGEYVPGQKLKQVALASAFKVSRTPIRQALSHLVAKGLVYQEQQSGVVVKAQSAKDVRDMYRVRAEVEGLAVQLAAHWITDEQLIELRRIHERFVEAVSTLNRLRTTNGVEAAASHEYETARNDWVTSNSDFHAVIYKASCNPYLQKIIGDLQLGSSRGLIAASALGMYKHRMEMNIVHHAEILAALEARADTQARTAMAKHILESGEFVAAWIENQSRG